MTNIQRRCNFRTGESVMASNFTDSISEDSNVLTSADVTSDLMQVIRRKIDSSVDTINGARRPMPATCVVLPQFNCSNSFADQQQQKQTYYQNDINTRSIVNNVDELKSNSSNVWIDLSSKVDTGNENIAWPLENTAPPIGGVPLYYQQVPVVDAQVRQQQIELRENQDEFQNLDNVASNGFDLLSYLCEDDISSLGDSISTDSSRDINSMSKLQNSTPHTVVSPKTYEPVTSSITSSPNTFKSEVPIITDSPYSKESPNPTVSSTSPKATISRRSSSQKLRTVVKMETPESPCNEQRSSRSRRNQMNRISSHSGTSRDTNKKRMFNDDSESDDGYRDTREKNNEASRKSRMNKKAKEQDMAKRAVELEKDNRVLKMKVEELEKLVSSMRNALLRSALKKEIKSDIF